MRADDLKALLTEIGRRRRRHPEQALTKNDIATAVRQAKAEAITGGDAEEREVPQHRPVRNETVTEKQPNAKRVYDSVTAYLTEKGLLD